MIVLPHGPAGALVMDVGVTVDETGKDVLAAGVDEAVTGEWAAGTGGDGEDAVAFERDGAGTVGGGAGAVDDEGVGDEEAAGTLAGVGGSEWGLGKQEKKRREE